jgi:hypothetical protein
MKSFWLTSCLLLPFGVAMAAPSDGKGLPQAPTLGGAQAPEEGCPAPALIARWAQAREALAALPEARRAAIEDAHATLRAACPVCQEAPSSFAFLGSFLAAAVALDERILTQSEEGGSCADTPPEVAAAFAERIAIDARARELFAAFVGAMAPPGAAGARAGCCSKAGASTTSGPQPGEAQAEPPAAATLADLATTFRASSEEALRLTTSWKGIPARVAALPAGTRADLLSAMNVLRELPTCELAEETLALLADGCARLVALDEMLAEHCAKTSATVKSLPPEVAQLRAAAEARARATVRALELLRTMGRTMTPELFESRS